jgi:cytochrome P450
MALLDHLRDTFDKLGHEIGDQAKEARGEVMEAVRHGFKGVSRELDAFVADLKAAALDHPREIFALLRKLQPILVVRDLAVVTRYEDVQEVLARDAVFDVTYAEKMELITNGQNFFLGMRDTPRYTRDYSNMRIAVRREDIATIVGPTVDRTAQAIVAGAGGTLDIVKGLTRVVPARFVGTYFGTPGPSEEELIAWTSTLFQFLFFDQANDPALRARALTASAALNAYIDRTIAERKTKPRGGDNAEDVLDRCLAYQRAGIPGMSDLDIRNNFIGLIIGAIPTTGSAAAFVVDALLDDPDQLAAACAAAKAGKEELVGAYVLEALRFNPMAPGIFRTANQDYTLGKGASRATSISAGTTVVAATQSAMFDSTRIDDPDTFRVDRPGYAYLHWSYGLHTCFGQYINAVQISKIVKALLLRDDLRRAPGDAGKLQKEGPYAGSLTVAFS